VTLTYRHEQGCDESVDVLCQKTERGKYGSTREDTI
jgi:hypothetical protein